MSILVHREKDVFTTVISDCVVLCNRISPISKQLQITYFSSIKFQKFNFLLYFVVASTKICGVVAIPFLFVLSPTGNWSQSAIHQIFFSGPNRLGGLDSFAMKYVETSRIITIFKKIKWSFLSNHLRSRQSRTTVSLTPAWYAQKESFKLDKTDCFARL